MEQLAQEFANAEGKGNGYQRRAELGELPADAKPSDYSRPTPTYRDIMMGNSVSKIVSLADQIKSIASGLHDMTGGKRNTRIRRKSKSRKNKSRKSKTKKR